MHHMHWGGHLPEDPQNADIPEDVLAYAYAPPPTYPKSNLNERDFNILLHTVDQDVGEFLVDQYAHLLLGFYDQSDNTPDIDDELDDRMKLYAKMLGLESKTSRWDRTTERFRSIPKSPRNADELCGPLAGIINMVLQGPAGRGSMVYFSEPHDLKRTRKNGEPWVKRELIVMDVTRMQKFKEEKRQMEEKAKERDSRSGPSTKRKVRFATDAKDAKISEESSSISSKDYDMLTSSSATILTEVCIDSKIKESRKALLVYAKQHLCLVHNRQFLFCLLFTESVLEVYSVDRMGIYSTTRIAYHESPLRFATAVLIFADIERVKAQFSMSVQMNFCTQVTLGVFGTNGEDVDMTRQDKKKILKKYRASAMLYPDPSFLEGIYSHAANYPLPSTTSQLETTLLRHRYQGHQNLLFVNHVAPINHPSDRPRQLIRTKIQLVAKLKNINDFSSQTELLDAFIGAIKGHQGLSEAGILHGDISLRALKIAIDGGGLADCEIER